MASFGYDWPIFEASFDTPGLELDADTVYWISAFGATAASNASIFNNYFASSAGASGTTANGVVIAPEVGVLNWTPVENVIGPPPLAFSFAIDGECAEPIPVMHPAALILFMALLFFIASRIIRMKRQQTA